jgi:hypothetical protein
MTIARTSIIQSGLPVPKKFWPQAVAHALFTKNWIPHRLLSEYLLPIEVLKPDSNICNGTGQGITECLQGAQYRYKTRRGTVREKE